MGEFVSGYLNITVRNLSLRGIDFLSRLSNIIQNYFLNEVLCSCRKTVDIPALKNENKLTVNKYGITAKLKLILTQLS